MEFEKIEEGFRLVLSGLGVDLSDPHLRDSPQRIARAWHDELCSGLRDPEFRIRVFPVAIYHGESVAFLLDSLRMMVRSI